MPDIEEDAARASGPSVEVKRPGLFAALKQSIVIHLERPLLLVIPLSLAIILFILDHLTGRESPDPRDLAKSFALSPLDVFSDLRFLGDRSARWALPIALALRVGAVMLFLSLLLRVQLTLSRLARVAAAYVIAIISFAIPFGMSAMYVNLFGRALVSGESSPIPLILLLTSPVLHVLLALVLGQLVVKAVLAEEARITFKDPVLWLLAALSTWIWFMIAGRAREMFEAAPAMAFGLAFAAVVAQAVILSAVGTRMRR